MNEVVYTLIAITPFGDNVKIAVSHDMRICMSVMHQLMMSPKGYPAYTIWDSKDNIIVSVTDFRF